MKKVLLLTAILMLAACGGVKKTQEALNTGNYNTAMNKAIKNLAENKTKKGNQEYIILLEEAFAKNTDREL
jgi:major membrane immunogen (membrane-anchored lipoprotein)